MKMWPDSKRSSLCWCEKWSFHSLIPCLSHQQEQVIAFLGVFLLLRLFKGRGTEFARSAWRQSKK